MRIGVDVCCWSNQRGFGRFTRELLKALVASDRTNEYTFFVDQQTAAGPDGFPPGLPLITVATDRSPTEAASATGRRSLSDLWKMTNAVAKHSIDLFFFPALYSYFPVRNRAKIVLTVMDMTPALFPNSVFPNRKLELFWNMKERFALWQADRIVTISEHSKEQITRLRGIGPSRISVVSAAPGDAFRVLPPDERKQTLGKYGLSSSDRYLLYVGGISPHKNLQLLLRVFGKLIQDPELRALKLMLAGDFEKDSFYSDYPALQKIVEERKLKDRVLFTGYISDPDLAQLYNAATLFVLPSLQEGFGLPAVEAMACGTPVVSSHAGSLREIVGDAGELFDPQDDEMAFHTIRKVLLDPTLQASLRTKGLQRATQFTWERAARQTLEVFDSM